MSYTISNSCILFLEPSIRNEGENPGFYNAVKKLLPTTLTGISMFSLRNLYLVYMGRGLKFLFLDMKEY